MANTITAANSVLLIGVTGFFPTPQAIQGFAADDMFDLMELKTKEIVTGVDGKLSAGWVYVPKPQSITLQADSKSNDFFDEWYASEEQQREAMIAFGAIHYPAISKIVVLQDGYLTSYKPAPEGKKYLQPRKYEITWGSVVVGPL